MSVVNFLRNLRRRDKLILLALLLLLLAVLFPPLAKILIGIVIVGLILYLIYTLFPDVVSTLLPRSSSKAVRRYVDLDLVRRRSLLIEVGVGSVLGRLNDVWFQVFLVSEPLPSDLRESLRKLDKVVLVSLRGNRELILVRDSDPEEVLDQSRLVESILRSSNIDFRTLNPEEAINVLLSLFRT